MRTWQCLALTAINLVVTATCEQIILGPARPSSSNASLLTPDFMLSATIHDLSHGLRNGDFTSVDITRVYLERIRQTSSLNAFLFENPYALVEASEADAQLSHALDSDTISDLPPLVGIPYALKGNIAAPPEIAPNTAGSFALLRTKVASSAAVEKRLRAQGAVLLGTTNLDEFAQAKTTHAPWGWSTLGGQMESPYYPGGDVCGSSGGSAIATSLGLAAFTLGTQTGWSITCPASRAGVVGFKPSPDSIDRTGIIPISTHRDAVGPIARSVHDAMIVYDALSIDANDRVCNDKRWRIGVAENASLMPVEGKALDEMLNAQSKLISALNSVDNVEIHHINFTAHDEKELQRLARLEGSITIVHDFRLDIETYLSSLHDSSGLHTLEDIRNWHKSHASLSLPPGPSPPHGLRLRGDVLNGSYAMQEEIDDCVSLPEPVGYANKTYRDVTENSSRESLRNILEPHYRQNEIDLIISISADGGSMAQIQALSRAPMMSIPLGFLSNTTEVDGQWPRYPFPNMPYGVGLSGLPHTENDILCFAEIVERAVAKSISDDTKNWLDMARKDRLRSDVLAQLEAAHSGFK